MASTTQTKLPVIDLTSKNLNLNSNSWLTKCNEVRRALEDYGCFIATYDGVSDELRDAMFLATQDLFNLPTEVKALNVNVDIPPFAYQRPRPMVTPYESLGIEDVTTAEGVERFTKLMWPSGNKRFSESYLMYSKALVELHQIVMKMVTKSYGIEGHYESFHKSMKTLFKPLKCTSSQGNEETIVIYEHTDKSFVTYLHQDGVNGLQILAKDGEWIKVQYPPSSFVVLAGEALMAWTNGRIEAGTHRVMMTGNKERFSLALFLYFKDHEIQIPQELVDENHPLQFRAFDNYKYLLTSFNDDGLFKSNIKSYCGI